MNKLKVGVVYGSRSTEHDISVVTAIASIIKPLELSGKYEVVPIYIDKQGFWYSDPKLKDIALFSSGEIDNWLKHNRPVQLGIGDGLSLIKPGIAKKPLKIDVVFPATHGTHGEDGELMGLLEMANVAYVGCNMPSSALAMDKALAKIVAQESGIASTKYVWFYARDFSDNAAKVLNSLAHLRYPLFVKPVHLGSSIAITRVKSEAELKNAIEVAAHYDNKVIVEEEVQNLIEATVPIMGNDKLMPALVEQPVTHGDDFFDFETKYMAGGKKGKGGKTNGSQGYSRLPADLPKDLMVKAEQTALGVYKALGCSGIARIDLLVDTKANQVYFNEVNPLPGSLYAHNWRAAGKSNVELVDELVKLALDKYAQQQKLSTVFATNYLKQY